MNTIPKYSVRICNVERDSIFLQKSEKKKWISAVLGDPQIVIMFETILIYEFKSPLNRDLYALCPYCDLYDPFKLVPVNSNIKELTNRNSQIAELQKQNRLSFRVIRAFKTPKYDDLQRKSRRNQKAVFEHIK